MIIRTILTVKYLDMSMIIPPSVHYTQILPSIKNKKDLDKFYAIYTLLLTAIIQLHWMYQYKNNGFRDPKFYSEIQQELQQMERYVNELEELYKEY